MLVTLCSALILKELSSHSNSKAS